jgi:hypothetical protein
MSNSTVIVLDIDGKGIMTEDLGNAKVRYDWDGDGLADQTSWIGSTNAFLFLDRDGNGTVTDSSELSFWPTADAAGASASLLSFLDSNHDGAIAAADADWSSLKIWEDKNGNGVADIGEILTLDAAGIRSISDALTAGTGAPSENSATTLATGSFTRTNGTTQSLSEVSLGYVSVPVDGLPKIDFLDQSFDLKEKKYRLTAKNGQAMVAGKHLGPLDSRAGGLGGAAALTFKHGSVGMLSALAVDLDGNGVSLVRRTKSHAFFDMNGDGVADDTGWISKRDGFLVIDRNNDGVISGPSELSFLSEDQSATSSLAGLLSLDSNGDKILDKKDARFGELKIWVDANGNGVSDQGELKTLSELGIVSIDLTGHNLTGSAKIGDNLLLATATFTRENGTVGTIGDAALSFVPHAPAKPVLTAVAASAQPQTSPVDPVGTAPWSGALSTAANQFASAIAAFGAQASTGNLDGEREMLPRMHSLLASAAKP